MRLLIASDIHGSLSALKKVGEKARTLEAEMVLLLGDILYHGPRNPLPDNYNPAEVVKELAALPQKIIAVKGNCDSEVDEMVLPFHLAENSWLLDGLRSIFIIHGHQLDFNGGTLKSPAGTAVLSGHTHVPTAEQRGDTHYWNPGSASLPKQNFPASFGFYENRTFSVRTFEDKILMENCF